MPRSQHSERYRRFCELLRETRRKKGLTQAEVATRLHKPQSYVSKYEAGERRLDILEFLEVAVALEVDPARLIRQI